MTNAATDGSISHYPSTLGQKKVSGTLSTSGNVSHFSEYLSYEEGLEGLIVYILVPNSLASSPVILGGGGKEVKLHFRAYPIFLYA